MNAKRLAVPTLLAALAAVAAIAPNAFAANVRYAGPTGTGTDCTPASPCSIRKAVEGAGAGDEVVVNPGDYSLAWGLVSEQITIHGVAGQPRPRLMFDEGGMNLYGSTLRYVEVESAWGSALSARPGSVVDQVVAKGGEPYLTTATVRGSTIRNSVVVASGMKGRAIATHATDNATISTLRNVTALAIGTDGVAIEARAAGATGSVTIHAVNTIARGGPGGAGLKAITDSSGAQAAIAPMHSNYDVASTDGSNATITNGGGNQTDPPDLVNPAAGDYRQASGSPTVGAGVDDPANGTLDADGDPRSIGTTDIGADEFVLAPAAATGPAGPVGVDSATLSGSVDPTGAPTTYHFEYGTTTAYGHTTPAADAGSGTAGVPAAAAPSGLSPGTTYHYRIVASNAGGVTYGADRTFTTAAAPVVPPTATPSTTPTPPAQPFAGVGLVSRRLSYARRAVMVTLSCPAGTIGRCSGYTRLTARARRSSARPVTLGRAAFSIAAGGRATIKVSVSRAGRRLFHALPQLRGKAVNTARDTAGQSRTTGAGVTIRRRGR